MVNNDGQLYTIEGIAASVLIMTTVYMVLNTTTVFTPGETHVYDMQLEQLGNDVLAIMDINPIWIDGPSGYPESPLEQYIHTNNFNGFQQNFIDLATLNGQMADDLNFRATIYYYNEDSNVVESDDFGPPRDSTRERAVKVSRWVNINNIDGANINLDHRVQTVLLEVLLWRG